MILQAIEAYIKAGGTQPYALLVSPYVQVEFPDSTFVCVTKAVNGVVVLPVEIAKVFVHGSVFVESVVKDGSV